MARRRRQRRLADLVLLPPAFLAVLAERGVRGWGRGVGVFERSRPVAWLRRCLTRVSPLVALPLFLVPEALGHLGTVWAAIALAHGHPLRASLIYGGSRLATLLMLLVVWEACAPALLQVRWFARAHAVAAMLRDRLSRRLAWRAGQLRRRSGRLGRRFRAWRLHLRGG